MAAAIGAAAASLALLAFAGWREATATPVIAAYDIAIPDWPAGQGPLRIVQLSDTHAGPPDMPLSRLARIVDQVNALAPDLVVLTGDYQGAKFFDGDDGNLDDVVRPFERLRSRYGTFGVRGNHDNALWSPRVIPRYRITYLQNRWVDAGPVVVAGLDDLTAGIPEVGATLAGAPPGKPVILLMHEPDLFPVVPPRVTLTFAGHTHGGQIMLPIVGPLVMNSQLKYRRGLVLEGGRRMIVSSGVGTTGIPMRLGVPPEIVVVTLHGYSVGRKSGTER
ncbi:MAG: metallophosphoesterase [Janthinobacterium lividum]